MTMTVSARINSDLHEKLVNICNELGKTMNELLNDCPNWLLILNFFDTSCIKSVFSPGLWSNPITSYPVFFSLGIREFPINPELPVTRMTNLSFQHNLHI